MTPDDIATLVTGTGFGVGHPDVVERFTTPLRAIWADMEALPRTDPFWTGQWNDRATVSKLRAYASERLRRDPTDRAAGRTLAALDLHYGANEAGLPYLAPELDAEPAVVGDAVVAAQWIWEQTGVDTTHALRRALADVDRGALTDLTRGGRGWTATAARVAMHILGGLDLDTAYARSLAEVTASPAPTDDGGSSRGT
ncbi:hypothetical protein DMB66_49735 [Actinoplanes sp. ATCC 53533]|uniref:hypothetical protein n=1 Tax=Actinoplanes sp. ATCC 53533 TaxID=1288362 RepID=UPI000F7B0EAF|nr:hypothetical protein [Actinoplanes sp. ATCC 53533]RSM46253.1 hypothetical protein DMB66_49735 [Actinoplanes sp. ATCC 53533]